MHILHFIGIFIIISLLATGAVLFLQIVKLEKEILIEKNEGMGEAADSGPVGDASDFT
jgi:hypothetical protein